jgi:hypothetical protein
MKFTIAIAAIASALDIKLSGDDWFEVRENGAGLLNKKY